MKKALLCAFLSAQTALGAPAGQEPKGFQIELRIRDHGSEGSYRFLTVDGAQSNYVTRDKKKNWSMIANFLPASATDKPGLIVLQYQIELDEPDGSITQLQNETELKEGRELTVLDTPTTRLTIKIDRRGR